MADPQSVPWGWPIQQQTPEQRQICAARSDLQDPSEATIGPRLAFYVCLIDEAVRTGRTGRPQAARAIASCFTFPHLLARPDVKALLVAAQQLESEGFPTDAEYAMRWAEMIWQARQLDPSGH